MKPSERDGRSWCLWTVYIYRSAVCASTQSDQVLHCSHITYIRFFKYISTCKDHTRHVHADVKVFFSEMPTCTFTRVRTDGWTHTFASLQRFHYDAHAWSTFLTYINCLQQMANIVCLIVLTFTQLKDAELQIMDSIVKVLNLFKT